VAIAPTHKVPDKAPTLTPPTGPTLSRNTIVWLIGGMAASTFCQFGINIGYNEWRWATLPRAEADMFFQKIDDLLVKIRHLEARNAEHKRTFDNISHIIAAHKE
jgi:hypothetical protein